MHPFTHMCTNLAAVISCLKRASENVTKKGTLKKRHLRIDNVTFAGKIPESFFKVGN